jgi:RecA-family ATPase
VTIIDGDPGLGKSTLALDIAARTTTGSAMPDGSPAGIKGCVIYLTAEDVLEYTIRPRLDAAGADVPKVFSFDPDAELAPLTLPHDINHLEATIKARDVRLVVIDPLVAYLGVDINSHRDQDVRRALAPLQRMAERTATSIIGIRHLNKAQGTSALYRGGGSIAIIGAARAGFLVGLDPDDPEKRVFARTKGNLSRNPEALQFSLAEVALSLTTGEKIAVSKIAWLGKSERSASELLETASEDDKSAQDDAADFLQEFLWDGPKPTKQVQLEARRRGLSWRTIKRAKTKAGAQSHKSSFDGEWTMRLELPKGASKGEEVQ